MMVIDKKILKMFGRVALGLAFLSAFVASGPTDWHGSCVTVLTELDSQSDRNAY